MRLKKGIVYDKIDDKYIAVPTGEAGKAFNGMIRCNKTSIILLDELHNDKSEDELVKALVNRFEVEENVARQDVQRIIAILKGANLLDD